MNIDNYHFTGGLLGVSAERDRRPVDDHLHANVQQCHSDRPDVTAARIRCNGSARKDATGAFCWQFLFSVRVVNAECAHDALALDPEIERFQYSGS